MECMPTGERAQRRKKRKVNTTNGGEIVTISGPKWDGDGEHKSHYHSLLSKNLLFHPSYVAVLGFWSLNPPRWVLIYQKKVWELMLNYYSKYCIDTFRTYVELMILHFLNPSIHFFSPAFLSLEWDGLVSQMGCYSPISVRDITETRPYFWLDTLSRLQKTLPLAKS